MFVDFDDYERKKSFGWDLIEYEIPSFVPRCFRFLVYLLGHGAGFGGMAC